MPETSLFRQEAVDAQRGQWLGSIVIATPLSRWALVLFALALATAMLLLLIFGHYTRRETVAGQLVPSAGLLNIVTPVASMITRVHVRDGQTVKAGDPLIELSGEQDSVALGGTNTFVGQQLDAQRTVLQADLLNQQKLLQQQAGALHATAGLLRRQLTQISDELEIQRQKIASDKQLLERIKPLEAKGYVSVVQIQQQKTETLNAQSEYMALVRQQLDIRQQLAGAQQQLAQLPLNGMSERNGTERQLASVRQSMAQNEMQRAVILRASTGGVISTVLVKDGQTAVAGQTLMTILPLDSVLQAQLLVPSRAVGFIEPGSRVVLRYQAFPYQKFGQQYGRVTDISRSALNPADVTALTGQASPQQPPMYRILVRLDQQSVLAYGRRESMRPGMALDADILMDRRRLIEWVFEPIYGAMHRMDGVATHG